MTIRNKMINLSKIRTYEQFMADWRKFAPNGLVKAKTDSGEVLDAVAPPSREHVWNESHKSAVRDTISVLETVKSQTEHDKGVAAYLDTVIKNAKESIGDVEPPDAKIASI